MATDVHTFYTSSQTTHAAKHPPQLVEDLLSKYQSSIYASSTNSSSLSHLAVKSRPSVLRRIVDRTRLGYYRYEVTFGVYVMSPGEKWVVNTFVIVVLSLLIWALFLYFPQLLYHKLGRLVWLLTGQYNDDSLGWSMFDEALQTRSLDFPINSSLTLTGR